MFKFSLGFSEKLDREDVLTAYRERLLYRFAIVFIVLFLPLMIFNFFKGHYTLATGIGCLWVIVILNAIAIQLKKDVPIARTIFIIGLAIVVGIAIINRGVYGTYWTYPAVLFISFSATLRLAKIFTTIFFVYCSSLIFYLLDFGLALRAVVGLCITILFTNLFLGMIEKLQQKLIEQSLIDPLTGALNRRQMSSSLAEATERKIRTNTPASILIFDIDNFKSINDKYGHAVGDQVLKKFVSLVSHRKRHLDQLFRIGGEEFMLFLPDTSGNGALTLAEEIRVLISESDFIEGQIVTVSIGLSEIKAGDTIDEWMNQGDNALYKAKENGRNQVFFHSNSVISNQLLIVAAHTQKCSDSHTENFSAQIN